MFGASGARYNFNNVNLTNSAPANANGGWPFASFLMGVYNQATLRETLIPYYYQWNSGALYVQNDWKLRPNLTVNLGLRYSLQLPRTEKYDRQGAFLPELSQTITLTSAQRRATAIGMALLPATAPPDAVNPAGVRPATLQFRFGFSGRGAVEITLLGGKMGFGSAIRDSRMCEGRWKIREIVLRGATYFPSAASAQTVTRPGLRWKESASLFDIGVQNPFSFPGVCNKHVCSPKRLKIFFDSRRWTRFLTVG